LNRQLQARAHLLDTVTDIIRVISLDYITGIKTVVYYTRALRRAVVQFYNREIDAIAFIGEMIRLIDEQMRRAWNEGMRANDLDPKRDMKPEWEAILESVIDGEYNRVLTFAEDIERSQGGAGPIEPLLARVDLWVNRYNETVNLAIITTRPNDHFIWRLGATEEHCSTCARLNGVVATAAEWQASGVRPQHPPNPYLECGGWRCDCRYQYTEEPVTRGGIPI